MVEVMHKVLLEATKAAFIVVSFIVVTANEVTIIDNPMVVNSLVRGATMEEDSHSPLHRKY